MRIIAGAYKGRRIRSPADPRVRPTPERVREAWFSILSPQLHEARVLDLFAGSGVLGLEALSRGAASADFVELSAASIKALTRNVDTLGAGDRVRVHRGDALRFAERLHDVTFDLALADPPFGTGQAERLCAIFRARPFARLLSIEHSAKTAVAGDETRRYGDVALTFFHDS